MSAFVVSTAHIDTLVTAALSGHPHDALWYDGLPGYAPVGYPVRVTPDVADDVGRALLRANIAAVAWRYQDDPRFTRTGQLPGPIPTPDPAAYRYRFSAFTLAPRVSLPAMLKAVHCYRYQTSELPDWPASAACRFCDQLEHALIARLPGYEEAPWDIPEYPELVAAGEESEDAS